jgi:LacI family sucrose operon transcriptional repressor
MNISDIADLCGLSRSTVSRYFTGGSVSKKSAAKIASVIEKTGFEPSMTATRLGGGKSHLIGVLVDGIKAPAVASELTGMNEALHELGYQPFIMIDDHHDDNKVRSVQSLVRQGVDGVVFGAAKLTAEHVRSLYELEVPVLLLGQASESLPYVKVDDFAAGKLMGEHVRDSKPSSVVYLSLPLLDRAAGMERQQGFQSAFNGVAMRVTYIEGDHGVEAGYAMASDVIAAEPDFVVCASDSMCYGLMRAFDERGLRVPEDIRLAGFGDYEASSLPGVSLTSVSFDYEDLGREAARRAVALVEGREVEWRGVTSSITLHARRSSGLS